jgi:hypothetical protein
MTDADEHGAAGWWFRATLAMAGPGEAAGSPQEPGGF